ncbi:hypothetical protein DMC30DRAFT_445552 [Rhodotorula diobovata]|uniref:Uncharacterized protein n=1 Tax=Rhodotorula diobovata TaxID=5288 RepID=A0A5C5FZA0_9BASI|nr:hypothetical protein DMC30DRAFT_445552 [Rhodotorula diobovata]
MPPPSSTRRRRALLGLVLVASHASSALASPLAKRDAVDEGGYYNPTSNGGRWLTYAANSGGTGEPINVVVSGDSDEVVHTADGFYDWSLSINFGSYLLDSQGVGSYAGECLGQTDGERQAANLGDGLGIRNQTELYRENFQDVTYGVCKESAQGGYHYRIWQQVGPEANSSAWFLAASEEESLSQNHMIVPNGYDLGRDEVVRRATVAGGTTSPITNRTYEVTAQNASGPGYFANVTTSEINHGIATDGIVAVLTVRVTSDPVTAKSISAASRALAAPSALVLAQGTALALFTTLALALLA